MAEPETESSERDHGELIMARKLEAGNPLYDSMAWFPIPHVERRSLGYRALKRQIKLNLIAFADKYLNLYTPVADLGHPIALIRRLGLDCRGVIHVGANTGQEMESYRFAGLQSVVYIEPIPDVFMKLQRRIAGDSRHHAIKALCTEREGDDVDFYIASNDGQSSSIFEFGSHAEQHPDVTYRSKLRLQTTTLDHIIFDTPGIQPELLDCLVLDVQGAEANVLLGGERTLALCQFVFTEISEGGVYKGDVPFEEIIAMLKVHGFSLKCLDINRHGWGNAFFVKANPSRDFRPTRVG